LTGHRRPSADMGRSPAHAKPPPPAPALPSHEFQRSSWMGHGRPRGASAHGGMDGAPLVALRDVLPSLRPETEPPALPLAHPPGRIHGGAPSAALAGAHRRHAERDSTLARGIIPRGHPSGTRSVDRAGPDHSTRQR